MVQLFETKKKWTTLNFQETSHSST